MADAVDVAIKAALLDRAQAFATAQGLGSAISMPNVEFTPPTAGKTAKWLRATLLPNETDSRRVSDTEPALHFGFLQIDVFYGLGAGELAPGRIASAAIDYFPRGTVFERDGFEIRITREPYPQPLIKDDPWAMIPVRIPYQCLG